MSKEKVTKHNNNFVLTPEVPKMKNPFIKEKKAMDLLKIYSSILKSRFYTHTPLALTHHITSRCNARCKICDLWKRNYEFQNDLSKDEIISMLNSARKAGIISYTVFGGEPLLRKEIPEILHYAKKLGMLTSLITNGCFLTEKCDSIIHNVDYLIVSLDSHDELHDEMRGLDNLLERAVAGIKKCHGKTNILINSVITKLNLDKIEGLLELSKKLDVSITFEPMAVYDGYNNDLQPSPAEMKQAFDLIIKYKKSGYRVGNSYTYLKNFSNPRKYVCHAPKVYIKVDADGRIYSCKGQSWGNITEREFADVFKDEKFKQFCATNETCNKCVESCVLETSLAYALNPFFFWDKARSIINK